MRVQGFSAPMARAPTAPGKAQGTGFADLLAGPASNLPESAPRSPSRPIQGENEPALRQSPAATKDGELDDAALPTEAAAPGHVNLTAPSAQLPLATAPSGSVRTDEPGVSGSIAFAPASTPTLGAAAAGTAAASMAGSSFAKASDRLATAASLEMAHPSAGQAVRPGEPKPLGTVRTAPDAGPALEAGSSQAPPPGLTGASLLEASAPSAFAASPVLARQLVGHAFRLDELGMFGTVGPTSDPATGPTVDLPSQLGSSAALPPALSADVQPTSFGGRGTTAQQMPLTDSAILAGLETEASWPGENLRLPTGAAAEVQPAATARLAPTPEPDRGDDAHRAAPAAPFDQPATLSTRSAGSLIVAGPLEALQVVIGAPDLQSVPEALKDALTDAAASYGGSIADVSVNGRAAPTTSRKLSGGSNGRPR